MSTFPKTVSKNPTHKSIICDNMTAVPSEKKCKSLKIPNRVFMMKDGRSYAFPVYQDNEVGIDQENGGRVIELKVDEDCESTNSIVNYGVKLCQEDLHDFIRDNRSEYSDMSY